MKLYVCDICGSKVKLTEHNAGTVVINISGKYEASWPGGRVLDVCPECMKTVCKVLKIDLD